jgi:drug/metabolite transporter (DMT)-like permease
MQVSSSHDSRVGALCGLGAAALFGLSMPLSKLLLPGVGTLWLAGLLYLGAGAGLSVARALGWSDSRREAQLRVADLATLAGVIALGGIAGPVLMLFGLSHLSAVPASLLLNLEAPLTIAFAVLLFGEHLDRRGVGAAALIVAGAVTLGVGPEELRADPLGIVCIAGACACWALDNNLTQRLMLRDPLAVVRWKTLGAGACTTLVAALAGGSRPESLGIAAALGVGAVCYGASILLAAYSLRLLGAAREAAYFATAPFVGALLAIPLVGESPRVTHAVAAVLMAGGVALLLRERHSHRHVHEPLEHDHVHVHDEHHRHEHPPGVASAEPHAHLHRHERLEHEHPHVSDLHHRHAHR